ncbi:hypothetical protein SKAU_G00340910 [Synaphobranchus kaupii]|uniref:Uncharacterized protein n=1 Tax=Synaphobranchus kaupii TaxID=118154 RepID=A0A9Q1EN57_SYNKA|nr:hypothetical protein SKAU_G00340910 [Synaphobranchus kaupii]
MCVCVHACASLRVYVYSPLAGIAVGLICCHCLAATTIRCRDGKLPPSLPWLWYLTPHTHTHTHTPTTTSAVAMGARCYRHSGSTGAATLSRCTIFALPVHLTCTFSSFSVFFKFFYFSFIFQALIYDIGGVSRATTLKNNAHFVFFLFFLRMYANSDLDEINDFA